MIDIFMQIHLIKTKEEYIEKFPYDEKYANKSLPSEYPCILSLEHNEGGLGGSHIHHKNHYIPKDITNVDTYFKGILKGISICR
jgi:hypothetical protein